MIRFNYGKVSVSFYRSSGLCEFLWKENGEDKKFVKKLRKFSGIFQIIGGK